MLHPSLAASPQVAVPMAELFAVAQEYLEAGRLDAASRLLGHVTASHPGQPDAAHMRGLIAHRRGDGAGAVTLLEQAVAADGGRAVFWRNLSEVCRLHASPDRALLAARRAVALDPADALGFFNLAMVHHDRLEIEACIAAARASLDLKPGLPQAHMKLAQAYLLAGALAPGWAEYEWRYQIPGAAPLMPAGLLAPDRPQWDGAPLSGRLLLIADQGYGDVIQFARYIPWALARCPDTVIAASIELRGLLARMYPGLPVVTRWEEVGGFAAYCPLTGLARLHGTTLSTIPDPGPYLHMPDALVARWRGVLDARLAPGRLRVGIAWAGRPTHNNDANRSTTLATLAPLAAVDGVALVSLQKGPAARQTLPAVLDLDADIDSFDDTAAIIAGLDLVIGVDTAIVHLAGALGRPTWVMLPYSPDWRWLLGRSDTPWYSAMRLFRPTAPRDWGGLVAEVTASLADLARATALP